MVTSPWRERREVWREKRKVRIFGKGKCKLIANCANFWQVKVCSSPILARQWWRHFRLFFSLSLSLYLSLSLSLSPKVPHAQYRKRFRASNNKFKYFDLLPAASDKIHRLQRRGMSHCTMPLSHRLKTNIKKYPSLKPISELRDWSLKLSLTTFLTKWWSCCQRRHNDHVRLHEKVPLYDSGLASTTSWSQPPAQPAYSNRQNFF